MASITKRKNKQGEVIAYQIRVYKGSTIDGKHQTPYNLTWVPEKGMTEKQIQRQLQKIAMEFETQCEKGGVSTSAVKLSEFCSQYLQIMKNTLSPSTYEFYSRNITDCVIPALGNLKIKDVKPAHIQQYINQLTGLQKRTRGQEQPENEKISPSTVRRYLTVVQSIFKQAVKLGLITDNPAKSERLTMPKALQPKIDIFTKQEAAKILSCLEKEPLQFQALIQLAIYTGARRGELVALKFSDVDFENLKITVERAAIKLKGQKTQVKPPKDYEVRTITVNPACISLIEELQREKEREAQKIGSQWHNENWLFTTWNGEIMNPQTPTAQFSKFLSKNDLPHRKFHALRHTSATLLLYSGINIKQVQSRLGHGDIETTNKYLHCIEEADSEAAKALETLLNQTPTQPASLMKIKA